MTSCRRHILCSAIALTCTPVSVRVARAAEGAAASQPSEGDGLGQMRVKAAYLAKFGAFVGWPERAFASADAPLVIGMLDADALAEELALVVVGRSAQGRLIIVRKLRAGEALTDVQVLYVGDASATHVPSLLAAVRGQPVLTVADLPGSANAVPGTVITFVVVDRRLRFDVSVKAAAAAGLTVSARLLTAAHHVEAARP